MEIMIPAYAETVLNILEAAGFEAWCVGGCVRDSLLGLSPTDWDVTTNALPEETKNCFVEYTTVDIGMKHGTVAVLVDGHTVEVTTYRSDGTYADHRHPDRVTFSKTLDDDLSRRDFTVNAMAYHPVRGLQDEFHGAEDLKKRVLRCVGQPELRFTEDALRILRCLRFASRLGFSIEPETSAAVHKKRELLWNVSQERIRDELTKLLCGENAADLLREYSDVLFTVVPELAPMGDCGQENPYHCFTVWEHTLHAVEAIPPEPCLRWAALLHDCGKPAVKSFDETGTAHFYRHEKASAELAENILKRLRFSNKDVESVLALVQCHGEIYPVTEKRLKKLFGRLGEETLFRLFQLSRADLAAQAPRLYSERIGAIEQTEQLAREIAARGECLSLRDLAVNGGDLLSLGYPKSSVLGQALNALLDGVLDGTLPNEKAALLRKAEGLLKTDKAQ